MPEITELEQCPVCGGDPIRMNSNNLAFIVRCKECGTQTGLERCESDADSTWNERVKILMKNVNYGMKLAQAKGRTDG